MGFFLCMKLDIANFEVFNGNISLSAILKV